MCTLDVACSLAVALVVQSLLVGLEADDPTNVEIDTIRIALAAFMLFEVLLQMASFGTVFFQALSPHTSTLCCATPSHLPCLPLLGVLFD